MTSWYHGMYKGTPSYCLENDQIRLILLPELGAKIASLCYKPQQFEVLFQPAEDCYRIPTYGDAFARYDTSGADEMYPTIDVTTYPHEGYKGIQLPDHGELWSLPWSVAYADGKIVTTVSGVALPYTFSRSVSLRDNVVNIQYEVRNRGEYPLYGLWAFHGLINYDAASRLIMPQVGSVITVHDSNRLGLAGTIHTYPNTNDIYGLPLRLDVVQLDVAGNTEKFYVDGKLLHGRAGLTLNNNQLLYQVTFPEDLVPYLGVWINAGGFKGEHNCALEPSTGFFDTLETACKHKSIQPIPSGECLRWHLNIELRPYQ